MPVFWSAPFFRPESRAQPLAHRPPPPPPPPLRAHLCPPPFLHPLHPKATLSTDVEDVSPSSLWVQSVIRLFMLPKCSKKQNKKEKIKKHLSSCGKTNLRLCLFLSLSLSSPPPPPPRPPAACVKNTTPEARTGTWLCVKFVLFAHF